MNFFVNAAVAIFSFSATKFENRYSSEV
jgi:hypothetical protein